VKIVGCSILLVVSLGVAYSFAAQAPNDTFIVYGAGAGSCRSWTDHLKDQALHPQDVQWVFGFVSAAGVFAGVQLKADANAIEPFVTKYCQEHPADTLTTAAANMVGNLR
jgi:hypothetical protein